MTEPHTTPHPSKAAHFMPHIQGLRAIAVLLVVVYHFWPGRLSGGYIGVDIFFVISGFLITGQLARELQRSGRIGLPTFWAKRARRLLPAAITVLIFCSLATLFILPLSALQDSLREILASTFYVENWQLAISSVDYLASGNATMVQHYWSLALEEQFYVFWPLILLGAVWLGAKFFGERRWLMMVWVVVGVSILSLLASVIYTQTNPAEAYFVTFTRVWEFGVGAVLALLPRLRATGAWWPNFVGYAGLAAVLGAGVFFDRDTAFPGYLALIPVLGTAAIIMSDRRERWWDIGSVLSGRPQRFIGDISYSLYLWHWPLIIMAPYIPGWGLETWNRLVLFTACFVLAWLTKNCVEDPFRVWKPLTARRPRVTAAAMAGIMVLSAAFAGLAWTVNAPKYAADAAALEQIQNDPPECFGAQVSSGCENPELASSVIPSPGFGNADKPGHIECFVQLNESALKTCDFGSSDPDAPRIALIGDSHGYQYIEALIDLAEDRGWALTTYLKGACPWSTTPLGGATQAFLDSCSTWRDDVAADLAGSGPYDAIFTAALAATPYAVDDAQQKADGFVEAWAQAGGAPIVTIVDNPDFAEDPNKCLRQNDTADCTEPRDDVLDESDPIAIAGAAVAATLLDFTDTYCDDENCFSVIGGANVYRDQNHLTVTFVGTLSSFIGDALDEAIARR